MNVTFWRSAWRLDRDNHRILQDSTIGMTFNRSFYGLLPHRTHLWAGCAVVLTVWVGWGSPVLAQSQASRPTRSGAPADTIEVDDLPEGAKAKLKLLNVKNADLRDVFRSIAHEHNLNLVVDNRIDRHVTVRLADLPVLETIEFLSRQNNLVLVRSGHIFHIMLPPPSPEPPPPEPIVSVQDSLLSVDLKDDKLEQVMRLIAQKSGANIVVRRGVSGTVTGTLHNVAVDQGLRTLLLNNGFTVREVEGIYQVDRAGLEGEEGQQRARAFWVHVEDSLITLDVVDARVADVLREVGAQMNVNLITYDTPEERITAKADSLPLDETLNLLLKRTRVTYRKEDDIYFIGERGTSGIATTRLLRLNHLRADAAINLVPELIKQNAAIQVVPDHNGLMITGTNDVIVELEDFIEEVDHATPQILIEALVVDFEANDLFELGLSFGRDAETAAAEATTGYDFRGDVANGDASGLRLSGDGKQINDVLDNFFGMGKIVRLPSDFFARIQALSVEGRLNIRSRPQIATLNGHSANLKIGTTQYYLLRTQTPYQNPNQVLIQQSQRFEKIEANVVLEITPWVSASGEITADIRPEFSTPVGEFDPDVPPTINSRVLESTVRLRDGETIILGGLIQDEERVLHNKVPILGGLPLVGRLFRSTSSELVKSELVIFLTPHVFYGDDRDNEKWEALQEEMDLQGLKERGPVQKLIDHMN